eukprot:scaffold6999_cov60-Phaeocystis_antarctica.AAC.1
MMRQSHRKRASRPTWVRAARLELRLIADVKVTRGGPVRVLEGLGAGGGVAVHPRSLEVEPLMDSRAAVLRREEEVHHVEVLGLAVPGW